MPHLQITYFSKGREREFHPADTHFSLPTELVAQTAIQKWTKAWGEAQKTQQPKWLAGSSIAIISDESGSVLPKFPYYTNDLWNKYWDE